MNILDYSVRQLWKTCVSVRKTNQEQKESPIELVIEKESFFQSFPAVRKLLLQKCIGKVRGGRERSDVCPPSVGFGIV